MRYRCLLVTCVLFTSAVHAREVPSRMFALDGHGRAATYYYPDDDPRRLTALQDVVTPHITWAKPLHGGPVRVLAIAHKVHGRWPVELAQRFDLDLTTVYGQAPDALGAPEGEGMFVQGRVDVEARLLQALNEPIDVVISDMPIRVLGEQVRRRLEALSSRGVGYVGPTGDIDLSAHVVAAEAQRDMVACAVPLAGLRLLSSRFATADEAGGAIIRLWTHATGGRVADISAYPRDDAAPDANRLQILHLPDMEWEAWSSLAGRAVLWAAARIPAKSAIGAQWPDAVIDRAAMPRSLAVNGNRDQALVVRVWDADGRLRWRGDQPTVPRLPAGRYFVGVQRVADEQIVDWEFGTLVVRAAPGIQSIEVDGRFKRPGESIRATVKLTAPAPPGATLRVEVLDNFGRAVSRSDLAARREVTHTTGFAESLHIYNYVNVQLIGADGEVLDEDRRAFYVAQPVPPSDDLVMMVWEAGAGFSPRRRILLKQFAALGMHAALTGPADASALPVIASAAMANAHTLLYTYRRHGRLDIDAQGVVHPCLSSSAHRSSTIARLKADVARTIGFSPLCYYLGDDVNYVKPDQDACWSPSCRALLAAHARREYESIDALNRAWGTSYDAFEQVEPIKRADVRAAAGKGDLAPLCRWIDHQLSADAMFAGFFRELGQAVQQVAPGTRANMNGDGWAWPGMGFDHWRLAEGKNVTIQYPNLMAHEIFRCATAPGALRGTWYGGYGLYNYRPYYVQDFLPWWCAFRGINMHGIFYGGQSPKSGEAVLGADLGPYEGFARILGNLRELRTGTSKLLSNATYDNDGVAMLYAPSSLHASLVFDRGLPKAAAWDRLVTGADRFIYMQSWEGMSHLLRDIGFSFDVVPSSHLGDGRFLEAGFRVLVLPLALRLTDAEAEAIRRFVRAGGTLIADALPGVFDQRARAGHAGVLTDVLGVRFPGGVPRDRVVTQAAAAATGEPLGSLVVDGGIVLDGASQGGQTAAGVPILTVHPYGKGRAVLLNVLARDYQIWRTRGTEMPFRDAVAALLATDAGLEPKTDCRIAARSEDGTHRIQVTERHRYQLGAATYVGLLRHARLRPDEEVEMADQRPKPGWIRFDRKAHVYDVRNRMYRGLTDQVEDVIYPARAELYALMPYEVRDLALRARQADNAILLDARIVPGDPAASATTHVLHVEIRDPNGRLRPELSRNLVVENGRLEAERFFIGYNAAPGTWAARVRDVATGMQRTASAPPPPRMSGLRIEGAELYRLAPREAVFDAHEFVWARVPRGEGVGVAVRAALNHAETLTVHADRPGRLLAVLWRWDFGFLEHMPEGAHVNLHGWQRIDPDGGTIEDAPPPLSPSALYSRPLAAGNHEVDLLEYFGQWIIVGYQPDDGVELRPGAPRQVALVGSTTRHNIVDPGGPVRIESPAPVVGTRLFHHGRLLREAAGGRCAAPTAPGRYCLQIDFEGGARHVPLTVGHGVSDEPGWPGGFFPIDFYGGMGYLLPAPNPALAADLEILAQFELGANTFKQGAEMSELIRALGCRRVVEARGTTAHPIRWWEDEGAAIRQLAREGARYDREASPEVLGFYITDEPAPDRAKRVAGMEEGLRGTGSTRKLLYCMCASPATPRFWEEAQSSVRMFRTYPIRAADEGGHHPMIAGTSDVMEASQSATQDTPLWLVAQAFGGDGRWALPTPAELRLQVNLGLARGIRGLSYFCWHSNWDGTAANQMRALARQPFVPEDAALYAEAGRINAKIQRAAGLLTSLRWIGPVEPGDDAFDVQLLEHADARRFVWITNLDHEHSRRGTVHMPEHEADIKVNLAPGDAQLVELGVTAGTQIMNDQWAAEPAGQGKVEWIDAPDATRDEKCLALGDGAGVLGPQFQVVPFQYYELGFRLYGPRSHWAALFYDGQGRLLDADNHSSLPGSAAGWAEQRFCFRARCNAATARIKLYTEPGMKLLYDDVWVRPVDRARVVAWADATCATMPRIACHLPPPQDRWKHLGRTIEKLERGGVITIVMLGDSMVNDAGNSAWDVLLERQYPGARVHVVTAVRGATGMHWFAESDRVRAYVLEHRPDLLILGGVSHHGRSEPYRQVIAQVRRAIDPDVLITTSAIFPSTPPRAFVDELARLAEEEGAAFLDMALLWREYLGQHDLGTDPPEFRRDGGHANARGKQFHARVLECFFRPPL